MKKLLTSFSATEKARKRFYRQSESLEYFGYTPGEVENEKLEPSANRDLSDEGATIFPIHGKKLEVAKKSNQEADDKGRRRHTTIMFTDIVGYTALMGSNEDRA